MRITAKFPSAKLSKRIVRFNVNPKEPSTHLGELFSERGLRRIRSNAMRFRNTQACDGAHGRLDDRRPASACPDGAVTRSGGPAERCFTLDAGQDQLVRRVVDRRRDRRPLSRPRIRLVTGAAEISTPATACPRVGARPRRNPNCRCAIGVWATLIPPRFPNRCNSEYARGQ